MNKALKIVGNVAYRTWLHCSGMASYGAGLGIAIGGLCAAVGWGYELGRNDAEYRHKRANRNYTYYGRDHVREVENEQQEDE